MDNYQKEEEVVVFSAWIFFLSKIAKVVFLCWKKNWFLFNCLLVIGFSIHQSKTVGEVSVRPQFFISPGFVSSRLCVLRCGARLLNVNGIRDPRQILHLCIWRAIEATTYQVSDWRLYSFFFLFHGPFFDSGVMRAAQCRSRVFIFTDFYLFS